MTQEVQYYEGYHPRIFARIRELVPRTTFETSTAPPQLQHSMGQSGWGREAAGAGKLRKC